MSSDSTNSKSQSGSAPRGQKRSASPFDHHDQPRKAANQSSKPTSSGSSLTEKEANGKPAWAAALQLRESQLEDEASRLRAETRDVYRQRAFLEAQETVRETMAEEREQHRKAIEKKDATIRSKDARISKLEGWSGHLWKDREHMEEQLSQMTTAYNEEKAAREHLESKMAKLNRLRASGCSLAKDVRFWYKNRQAGKFTQAGKYEEDVVRAAKLFYCGDASCTSCPK